MFKPTYIFNGIEEIELDFLKKENIKYLLMDVDNTIIDSKINIPPKKLKWLQEVKKSGIGLCILSNSGNLKKIKMVAERLDIPYLLNACKPLKKGFELGLKMLDGNLENTAIIGDQVFTDVLGANRFKIRSILVMPFDNKEPFWITIKRPIEKLILKNIKNVEIAKATRKKNKKCK